jgi:hypothetical protein
MRYVDASALKKLSAFPAFGAVDLEPVDDPVDCDPHFSIAELDAQLVLGHAKRGADVDSVISGFVDGINCKTHEHPPHKRIEISQWLRVYERLLERN